MYAGDLIWVKTYPMGLRKFPSTAHSNQSVMLHNELMLILTILEEGYYLVLSAKGVLYVKEPLLSGNQIVSCFERAFLHK